MTFDDQLLRIEAKLHNAKMNDSKFAVFGSSTHKYEFHPPATQAEITAFEELYNVSLPEDYKAFLTKLGNGGAGPGYGVYPLGHFGCMLNGDFLSAPPVIHSGLTEPEWKSMTAFWEKASENEEVSAEDERRYDALFSGLMCTGTGGCTFQIMLALNGADRGRVVDIDQDLQIPKVSDHKTFLDWYEAWLDRILLRNQEHE